MYNLDEIGLVWAEINLDNLAYNMKQVRKYTAKNALVMAVVKANAYGHGSIEASKVFLENGADRLGVAILREAIELRKENIKKPILILGYTPPSQYAKLFEYDLIQTIYNYEEAKILSNMARELDKIAIIHIKIDSGMGRLGFLPNEKAIEDILKISKLPNINIEGIYTHFAESDELRKSYTSEQYNKYLKVLKRLKQENLDIAIEHVSNSASIIDLPKLSLNMVRSGIMMYGLYPSNYVDKETIKLKPAMTLKAKISNLKIVDKGVGISYGQIFKTKRKSKIATLPLGYADGFTRILTNKAEVFINGERAKVVGKICMDQCMVDVTDIQDIKIGDEVVIFGYGEEGYPHVNELAEKIETINYEIVCMIGRRVPRVYLSNGKIVKIKDYLLD